MDELQTTLNSLEQMTRIVKQAFPVEHRDNIKAAEGALFLAQQLRKTHTLIPLTDKSWCDAIANGAIGQGSQIYNSHFYEVREKPE